MIAKSNAVSGSVAEFLASMPASYAQAFTLRDVAEHAAIVGRRGDHSAHVEAWHSASEPALVCVVADDQPGLLSLVSDALLAYGLSVANARVYCRNRTDGASEAVDFFQVEPVHAKDDDPVLDAREIMGLAETLRELIAEERLVSRQPSDRDTIPVPGPRPSRIYFDLDGLRNGEFLLIVETPDFAGLLLAISSALHSHGVRILASEIRTEDGFARDRFKVESADLQPLNAERLCDVQQALRAAVTAAMPRL